MSLFSISIDNKRFNIYDSSKPRSNIFVALRVLQRSYSIRNMQKPFIFTGLYNLRGGLYSKVYPIEEFAVDKPRYSIYQRSCTTDNIISFIRQQQRL